MKARTSVLFLLALIIILATNNQKAYGSNRSNLLVPLTFRGSNGATETLYLGMNQNATDTLDPIFGELGLPPPPPGGGFDIRFIGDGLDLGSTVDFHRYYSAAQSDTFRLQLYTDKYPIVISWPRLDSLFSGQVLLKTFESTIDMKATDSCVLTDPDIQSFRIFTHDPRPSDSFISVLPLGNGPNALNETVIVNQIIFPSWKTTAAWMEWGSTSVYGHLTPAQGVDSVWGFIRLSGVLENIQSVTTFHYRLVFQEGDSVLYTGDQTTDNPFGHPPLISYFSISAIMVSSAIIYLSASYFYPSAATAWIDWGTSEQYTNHTVIPYNPSLGYQYVLSNLQPGTIYHVRPSMQNSNGTTVGKDYRFFTGLPSPITLDPDSVTMTTAVLHGVCNPRGQRTVVYFLYHEYYTFLTTPPIILDPDTLPHLISQRVSGLLPNTTYTVSLYAQYDSLDFNLTNGESKTLTTNANPDAAGMVSSIHVKNSFGNGTLLHFGVYTDATNCVDFNLGEVEYPPIFAAGSTCDSRLVGPTATTTCLGQGVKFDLRPYFSPAQIDTYSVRFGVAVNAYPVTLEWPQLDSSYSGSVTLRTPTLILDMKSNHSLTFSDPDYDQLEIIAEGPKCVPGVPIVITDSAYAVDSMGIELTARVNTNEMPTSVWFQWGDSLTYTNTTDVQGVDRGRTFIPFQVLLSAFGNQQSIRYRAVAQNTKSLRYGDDQFFSIKNITSVGPSKELPLKTMLYQNYPNPFNPTTIIRYDLAHQTHVRLILYSVLGERIKVLVDEQQTAGQKQMSFDGSSLSSGIYFCQLNAGHVLETTKLILLK